MTDALPELWAVHGFGFDPGRPLGPQILVLGATYLAIDGAILIAMGASARRLTALLGRRAERLMNRVSGALMILAAALLALRGLEPAPER